MNSTASKSKKGTAQKKNGAAKAATSRPTNNGMLQEFFKDQLKDIYWAEKHLLKALPKMAKATTSEELKASFTEHLEVTQNQVSRLEEVFELLGAKAQGKKCEAMEGLTKEADSIIEETEKGTSTRDVGLIIAAQKVEHYEIASYGGLAQLATTLELDDIAALLNETLEEEKEADATLTGIAENDINYEAAEEDEEEGEEEEEA